MIETIVTWLQDLIKLIGPLGIGLATCIESFFAPIPSEPLLLGAGTTIETTPMLIIYITAATLGSYIGTLPFYLIGSKSRKFVYKFFGKYGKYLFVKVEEIKSVEKKFKEKGKVFIFTGRLIPIVRSLISIPAGISKVDFKTYTFYTLLGSAIWNTLLISGGYLFKDQCTKIIQILDQYDKLVIILFIIFTILYLGRYIYKYHLNIEEKQP
ncbi:hypothetical protein GF362_06400 [Candidatus Dojkabacteria bacterium]|nr:hypothetical protein [Candidatus Dojkabacteria bacterium]